MAKSYRPTSLQVAQRAGVSQSAVSRCFTPGASISAKMRARVLRAANELGYQPNLIARSLVTNRSHLVAVILPDVTNRYYPEVLLCLSGALEENNLRMLLFTLQRDDQVDAIFQEIMRYQVAGVIMAGRPNPVLLGEYQKRGVPLVLYNRYWPEIEVSSVCCDHRRSAAELARRLFDAGHRHFGLITGPEESPTNKEREQGFRDQLRLLGVDQVPAFSGRYDYAASHDAMLDLVARHPQTDAVFCTNDLMAYAASDAIRHRVQSGSARAIAVLGFDDMTPSAWDSYQLTTVQQPLERMAQAAVRLLVDSIDQPDREPEHLFMAGKVVVRSSARL